jgi:hypothetical protein
VKFGDHNIKKHTILTTESSAQSLPSIGTHPPFRVASFPSPHTNTPIPHHLQLRYVENGPVLMELRHIFCTAFLTTFTYQMPLYSTAVAAVARNLAVSTMHDVFGVTHMSGRATSFSTCTQWVLVTYRLLQLVEGRVWFVTLTPVRHLA